MASDYLFLVRFSFIVDKKLLLTNDSEKASTGS